MTQTFAVDGNNDLYLNDEGNIAIVFGIDAVASICKAVTEAQLGEMIYATDEGMPTFQTVWVGVPNLSQYESAILTNLLAVPDVIDITDLEVSVADNALNYTATILTIYGQTTITNGI